MNRNTEQFKPSHFQHLTTTILISLFTFINQAQAVELLPQKATTAVTQCTLYLVATQNLKKEHEQSLHCEDEFGLSYELVGSSNKLLEQFKGVNQTIDQELTDSIIKITGLNKTQTAAINTAKTRFRQQLKSAAHPQLNISHFQRTSDQIIFSSKTQWSIFMNQAVIEAQTRNITVSNQAKLLASSQGVNERTALVLHVTANDFSMSDTPAALGDSVFGTNGDPVNMASQYNDCSYGQMDLVPAQGPNITNGVVEITIDIDVDGVSRGTVRNAVVAAANQLFGSLSSQADHFMFALPPNTSGGWIAYASVGGTYSTYNNRWATYVSAQLHELGHNFTMGHSGRGNNEYADESGMMGYSYSRDDSPVMCFNAAKSSKFGWYDDKELTFFESDWPTPQSSWRGQIAGIADYNQAASNQYHLVKIHSLDGNESSTGLFINFNRDAGINSGTLAGQDRLMVVSTDSPTNYDSLREASLNSGETATFDNFWSNDKDLIVKVLDIATVNDVMYADVEITVDFNLEDLIFQNGFNQ